MLRWKVRRRDEPEWDTKLRVVKLQVKWRLDMQGKGAGCEVEAPKLTSRDMMRAVRASHSSERATKSPKEDILSAPLALA